MIQNSWRNIEQEFFEYDQGDRDEISEEKLQFLSEIGFAEADGNVTDLGTRYLDSKFIFERENEWKSLLRNQILNLEQVRGLCQSFYGQQTDRENVERYFKSKTNITGGKEVGRILDLLNMIGIVSYNKRNATVQFKETDQVEEQGQNSYRTTRRTPYSNLMRFRKALRDCAGDLLWIDKHFSKKRFGASCRGGYWR